MNKDLLPTFWANQFLQFLGPLLAYSYRRCCSIKAFIPSKVSIAGRQLNRVEASEGPASCVDDELSLSDVNENTSEVEDTQEVDAQLKAVAKWWNC